MYFRKKSSAAETYGSARFYREPQDASMKLHRIASEIACGRLRLTRLSTVCVCVCVCVCVVHASVLQGSYGFSPPNETKENSERLKRWHSRISASLPKEIAECKKVLPSNAVIVDLGGNVGAFSEAVTRGCRNCSVYIAEAVPEYARFIKSNNPTFNVFNIGLSNSSGSFELWLSKDNLGWNTAIREKKTSDQEKISVLTRTFDDFIWPHILSNHNGRIDVLKIDVEGAEWMVLAGMHKALRSLHCLPHFFMEIGWGTGHPSWSKLKGELDFLHQIGYPEIDVPPHTIDVYFDSTCLKP